MREEGKFRQGRFYPQNPEKYLGNVNNIIYRSSWELRFLRWCDQNINILEYGSEEFFIPYISPIDNRIHRYYPDFIIKVRHKDESIKRYVIEVKPDKQTRPPKQGKRVTKSFIYETKTYAINQAKWTAAQEWCKDRLLEFKVITEKELFGFSK
jgi:hypothetical protein